MSFAASGHDKTIIPLYYNMAKSDLPQEFANLISHNIQENGFHLLPPFPVFDRSRAGDRLLAGAGDDELAIDVVVLHDGRGTDHGGLFREVNDHTPGRDRRKGHSAPVQGI